MKKSVFVPGLLAVAALVSACSSMPSSTSLLEQTRVDYAVARSNQNVSIYAQPEMNRAAEALGQANEAANNNRSGDKIDELAYIAKQKIALAQEVGRQKSAEAEDRKSVV